MAQRNWTYLADNGAQFRVGLYHGEETGHVLIYINGTPSKIDFNIRQTRSYSFFLDNELCKVYLEKRQKGWQYRFEIDTETNTPKNKLREENERNNMHIFFALLIVIVSIVGLIVWLLERSS